MSLSCTTCRDRLCQADWLTDADRRELDDHLAGCDGCRRDYLELKELETMLAETNEPPPAELADRIMAAVAAPRAADRSLPILAALLIAELGVLFAARAGFARVWQGAADMFERAAADAATAALPPIAQSWQMLGDLTRGLAGLSGSFDWTYPVVAGLMALMLGIATIQHRGDDHAQN